MTAPVLVPRASRSGIVMTWTFALVSAVVIAFVAPLDERQIWLLAAGGATVLVSFGANLWKGGPEGFILRVAISVVPAAVFFGLASVVMSFAA